MPKSPGYNRNLEPPRGVAQLAEHRSPKTGVAGSSPAALFAVRKSARFAEHDDFRAASASELQVLRRARHVGRGGGNAGRQETSLVLETGGAGWCRPLLGWLTGCSRSACDRAERVHLAMSIPRVVSGPTRAGICGAPFENEERSVESASVAGSGRRSSLRSA